MRSLLLLFAIHFTLLGFTQNHSPSQLRFNHLFLKDGLIEGNVQSIIQDNEGYMWMGTHNGVVRYDGYQPKTYPLNGKKLSRTRISDMYIDDKGELWIGTFYNGLYKYDRASDSFISYIPDTANAHFIQSGNIENLISDQLGNIWFVLHDRSTRGESVFSFDVLHRHFTHYSNEEKGTHYTSYSKYFSPIVKDNKGNIWCGSDNGLKEYDHTNKRFIERQTINKALLQKNISLICVDKHNPQILWTAIWNDAWDRFEGLGRYNTDEDSLTIYPHANQPNTVSSPDDYIYSMNCDARGNVWIAVHKGLIFFDVASKHFTNYTPPASSSGEKNIYDIKEDQHGNFWMLINGGKISGELAYFNTTTKQFTKYSSKPNEDESFLSPHDLYLDREGSLWFGVSDKGVQWINKEKSKIALHAIANDNKHDEQRLFADCAEAPDHTIWFATEDGLCHWYPATDSLEWVSFGERSGSQPLLISTIMIDKQGRIWCGSNAPNPLGLCCYNPASKEVKTYTYNKEDTTSLSSNRVAALLEDAAGDIWIGTYSAGLCRLDQKTQQFTRYPHISNVRKTPNDNKLDDNDVHCLFEDKSGTIWVGTIWGSLNKLNKESNTFTSFGDKIPLLRSVFTIYEDSKNNLWAGTYTNGLFLIDRESRTAKRVSENDGLLYNEIEGILEDKRGNLWLKSARGISIYNPQTRYVSKIANELLEDDILNRLSYKTSSGLFIFSTREGFVTLHPNDFVPDSTTPAVHIESVMFNISRSKNKSVDSTILRYNKKEVHLQYDENRITFNYVGLLYQNTEQIRYRYKLDGYDNNWIDAGTQQAVTYTNLSPGTYTFHITAANSDGIWSKQEDMIVITIAPPFWETWWFRILVIIVVAGLTYVGVKRYLHRRLRAQQQEFERQKAIEKVRSKISMDIHDEISSGLTKISLLSQRVKTKYERSGEVEPELIDKIAGSSKEVISNLGEIIWAVNPKHDNLQSLLAYIRSYAFTFFEATPIEPCIQFPEEIPQIAVSPDVKHNLFLVVKEALNNIVKHAEATEAKLEFYYTAESYTLIIKDNGKGIEDLNGRAFGNGFTNMKKRMEVIDSIITIHSERGKGSQIDLKGRFRIETE